MKFSASLLCLALGSLALVAADTIEPVTVKGTKFFYKNGTQFFMRGVDYQPVKDKSNPDPLADGDGCKRDIAYFKQLNLNVIRVYEVQTTNNHDECMNALAAAGIYLLLDINTPKYSINRADPVYDTTLYQYGMAKVNMFSKYPNMLGFVGGNEVTNDKTNTNASAYVKAFIRDMKGVLAKNKVSLPVGYAANDDLDINSNLQAYFACGDETDRADFYGINIYRWCGSDTTFSDSGYDKVLADFTNYPVPVFFSEYGCITAGVRKFTEVQAIYGKEMTDTMSGGLVYEYSEEGNNYGLVKIDGNSVKTTEDFSNLKSEMAKINPKGVTESSYNPSSSDAATCPQVSKDWQASSTLPPTPSQSACDCVSNTFTCALKSDDDSSVGEILGFICGKMDCGPISSNTYNGTYGVYSTCNATVKVNWALSAYAKSAKNSAEACDFNGSAQKVTASSNSDAECKTKTDTISSGDNSSSSSSSSSDAIVLTVPAFAQLASVFVASVGLYAAL